EPHRRHARARCATTSARLVRDRRGRRRHPHPPRRGNGPRPGPRWLVVRPSRRTVVRRLRCPGGRRDRAAARGGRAWPRRRRTRRRGSESAAVAVGVRGLTLSGRAPLRPLPAVLVPGGVAVLPPVVTPLVVRAFVVVAPSDRHGAPTPRRRAPCAPGRGSRGRWRGTSAVPSRSG